MKNAPLPSGRWPDFESRTRLSELRASPCPWRKPVEQNWENRITWARSYNLKRGITSLEASKCSCWISALHRSRAFWSSLMLCFCVSICAQVEIRGWRKTGQGRLKKNKALTKAVFSLNFDFSFIASEDNFWRRSPCCVSCWARRKWEISNDDRFNQHMWE